jgi:hypothetical protein
MSTEDEATPPWLWCLVIVYTAIMLPVWAWYIAWPYP